MAVLAYQFSHTCEKEIRHCLSKPQNGRYMFSVLLRMLAEGYAGPSMTTLNLFDTGEYAIYRYLGCAGLYRIESGQRIHIDTYELMGRISCRPEIERILLAVEKAGLWAFPKEDWH